MGQLHGKRRFWAASKLGGGGAAPSPVLLCCEGRSKPGVWPHLGQILPDGSVPLPREPQGTRGAPGTLQPGFAATRFPAEPGASPPLPLHPPGTSTPKSPTDPSSKALSDRFTSSPVALTIFSRVEALCGGSASPAGARGDPPLPTSALETLPWPRTLARTAPSPHHRPAQPFHGVTHV